MQSALCGTPLVSGRPAVAKRAERSSRLQVMSAISRAKKEEVVAKVKDQVADAALIYSFRYKGLSVKEMEDFRSKLPEGSSCYIAKNTLVSRALDEDEKDWEAFKVACQGDNAFVFATEDAIKDSVKTYLSFASELADALPEPKKGQAPPPPPTALSGACMDGSYMEFADFKKLEKMPTKLDLIAKIAGMVKQVPTKVATATIALPRKVAYGVKALSDLDDDKSLTVEAAAAAKKEE